MPNEGLRVRVVVPAARVWGHWKSLGLHGIGHVQYAQEGNEGGVASWGALKHK